MYVSSGVAINEYFVIANKEIITNACIGGLSGLQGQLFIVDYYTIYPAVVYMSDSVSNMVLLKLKNPFTCPHGRPTAIKMTKIDIEKKFARIFN